MAQTTVNTASDTFKVGWDRQQAMNTEIYAAVGLNTAKVTYPGSADATELNILEGATLSTAELNYVKDVTSAIQTQLNAKAADGVNADITSMTGLDNDGIPLAKVATAAGSGANSDITSMTGLSDDGIPAVKVVSCLLRSLAVADLTDSSTPSVLTTAETTNTVISNYNSAGSADHVFTMPAAHAAGNIMFVIGDEFQIDIDPNSGDLFYLNGTIMTADKNIQNTADTLGESITGVCVSINGTLRWMFYSSFSNFVAEA